MAFTLQRDRGNSEKPRPRGRRAGSVRTRVQRFAVTALIVLCAFVAAPYAIAPFYRTINPVSIPMLWRWATGQRVERVVMPLDRISPALPLAVLVAEDGSFCHNRGIDLGAIREALQQSADDVAEARGASTITQQVAKNLFLWPGHSVVRKVLEIPLALWLNLVLPKRRILEIYFNIAEWGPNGEFGAEAASRWAFGLPARRLSAAQAASLAAILPNPVLRSARDPSLLVRRLAALYQRRAAEHPALAACVYGH